MQATGAHTVVAKKVPAFFLFRFHTIVRNYLTVHTDYMIALLEVFPKNKHLVPQNCSKHKHLSTYAGPGSLRYSDGSIWFVFLAHLKVHL